MTVCMRVCVCFFKYSEAYVQKNAEEGKMKFRDYGCVGCVGGTWVEVKERWPTGWWGKGKD